MALQSAYFFFNKEKWGELESRMEAAGKSKEEIESKKYYNLCLFINCEEREMPPPSIFCWRVRAVFAIYGTMIGSKAGMPLFNKQAWAKAENLIEDILLGYYSNTPGACIYRKQLNKDGSA